MIQYTKMKPRMNADEHRSILLDQNPRRWENIPWAFSPPQRRRVRGELRFFLPLRPPRPCGGIFWLPPGYRLLPGKRNNGIELGCLVCRKDSEHEPDPSRSEQAKQDIAHCDVYRDRGRTLDDGANAISQQQPEQPPERGKQGGFDQELQQYVPA